MFFGKSKIGGETIFHPTQLRDLIDERGCLRCFSGIEVLRDWTLLRLKSELRDSNPDRRGLALGTLMRCARPDDVFRFVVDPNQLVADWLEAEGHLEDRWQFWNLFVRRWVRFNGREPEV